MQKLSTNGLVMPAEFPTASYEAVYSVLVKRAQANAQLYEQFSGAWNAVSYRYLAVVECSEAFTASIVEHGTGPEPLERYRQERDLFAFFSNGVSAVDASFYGLFAIGAFLSPNHFPMTAPEDQQRVSAGSTRGAYAKAFPGDPILTVLDALSKNAAYQEWRDVRNTLTHRAAPGRRMYVGIPEGEPLPDEWKILNIPLNKHTTETRKRELAWLLTSMLDAARTFAAARL